MNHVILIAETPESIALTRVSNLVDLGRHQICEDSSTEPHHLVKPSRSQRWLRRYELICWECIGQKAVDMPRVHRLSLTKPLNGSYRARVERRTKYSWKRRQIRPLGLSIVSSRMNLGFSQTYDLVCL